MKNGKLGFGLMRLPQKEGEIDIEEVKKMVDLFLASGFTYFDTAYAYGEGASERAARDAIVRRYPRDAFTLATKLCKLDTPEMMHKELEISLERTEAKYFDFYLLHALSRNNIDAFNEANIWDFVEEAQEKGLIRRWGFSFHDSPEFLEKLLLEHPDASFVQLQINYADWNNPQIQSRACYEVARKYNKEIIIMEPVKGGSLANPSDQAKTLFQKYNPNASYASWALRFASSLEGVLAVLSGMSTLEQVEDNCSFMKDFVPLNKREYEIIQEVQKLYAESPRIACTACHYCTHGCPMQIRIPEIFAARNLVLENGDVNGAKLAYQKAVEGTSLASECVACGQCEGICPQGLKVIQKLAECAAFFEGK